MSENTSGKTVMDKKEASEASEHVINHSADLFKVLASPLRIKILMQLKQKEMSVHDIQEALNISQPLASQHIKVLKAHGLLLERRQGKYVYYRLKSAGVQNVLLAVFQIQLLELGMEAELMSSLTEMASLMAL